MNFGIDKETMSSHPNILLVSANICADPYPVFPLGVACLQSYMGKEFPDWSVSFFDFNIKGYQDFEMLLKSVAFDYIGISLRNCDDINFYVKTSFLGHYIQICEIVRNSSSAKLIIGGPCVSIFPKEVLALLNADFAIVGEGEQSLCELIRHLENKERIDTIEGLCFRNPQEEIIVNNRAHFLSSIAIDFDLELANYYYNHSGMLNIQTKRGCPYHCIYCSYPVIDGRKVRTLDSVQVVENVKRLVQEQNINYLFFTDSVFNLCEEYNIELAHRLIESGVKVNWGAYFSPKGFKKETMELYKRAGLTHIEFGSDSFADQQLERYQKHFRFEDIKQASDICNDLGIFYAHFLILGGIGETNKTLAETFENSKQLSNTIFFPFVGMRIYPKTELFNIAIQEGVVNSEEMTKPVYYLSKDCSLDNLKEQAKQTNRVWVFPDDDKSPVIDILRAKKRRGLLWEHLRS